jgi:hypothetical protein
MRAVGRLSRILCAATLASVVFAQAPDEKLIPALRARVERMIRKIPNYTCIETTTRRDTGAIGCPECEIEDRIRLEVAVVDRREMFALPGSSAFGQTKISAFVSEGTVASGDYTSFIYAAFSDDTTLSFVSAEKINGRRVLQCAFECAPRHVTSMRSGVAETLATLKGHLWFDPVKLELVRLDVDPVIPKGFRIQEAHSSTTYHYVHVGESDFLLPARTEWRVFTKDRGWSRNTTEYSGCRQYAASSSISFGEEENAPAADAPRRGRALTALPEGLAIQGYMEDKIDFRTSAVGDVVTATVLSPVKKDGAVVVPKGAKIQGRIVQLEEVLKPAGQRRKWLALKFQEIHLGESTLPFDADLKRIWIPGRSTELSPGLSGVPMGSKAPWRVMARGDQAGFLLIGGADVLALPRGVYFEWKTENPRRGDQASEAPQ